MNIKNFKIEINVRITEKDSKKYIEYQIWATDKRICTYQVWSYFMPTIERAWENFQKELETSINNS